MIPDEPLLFEPIYRSYLWGGQKLKSHLNKRVPDGGRWAESWEIVDHGTDQSIVHAGRWKDWSLRQMIESFPEEILGDLPPPRDARSRNFPLLLKYLDCNSVLSVQVHPDDEYAARLEPPDLGKTEAWYIVDAEPEAILYAGLREGVDRAALAAAVQAGRTEECLHELRPRKGDCVFIPAGTVHALGSGLIVAEIQQASDTTFRLFDWNRVDAEGKSRPLHIDQALAVIDFDRGPIGFQSPAALSGSDASEGSSRLIGCDKFTLDRHCGGSYSFGGDGHFHILTIPAGSATYTHDGKTSDLPVGRTVFVPAACEKVCFSLPPDAVLLHAWLPG